MNKQIMIEKYVALQMELQEKQAAFNKYYGEGSIAEDIIDTLEMFIINEMLEVDGAETESDMLLMDFIDWKRGVPYSGIEHPETGKLIETVEELMPFLQFKK